MAWFVTIVGVLLGATAQFPAGGNALTLPAHRHLVRIDTGNGSATWLLALQQEGAGGRGLSFYRSDDEARTWRFLAPIQSDPTHADRADLVAAGRNVALVYSYEGPALSGSSQHDVWFQWWRWDPAGSTFRPQPAIRIFDSMSNSIAYYRAELAIDSAGRIFVQAFRLEPNGSHTAVLAVSKNGGSSFTTLPSLDNVPGRGGGRLLHLGRRLIFVYAMHDGFKPTRFRLHEDTAAPGDWGPVQLAFPEGIYHGAALSAVDDGRGGMHLVYKSENDERIYYRHFGGSRFGGATLIDPTSDWALQSAITRVEQDLYIFYNHKNATGLYDFRYRLLAGCSFTSPVVLDGSATWKGYPASAGVLPSAGVLSQIPAFFGSVADPNNKGWVMEVAVPNVSAPTCGSVAKLPVPGQLQSFRRQASTRGMPGPTRH